MQKREEHIDKYRNRDRDRARIPKASSCPNMLVFKCPFGQHMKRLAMKKEFQKLLCVLRAHLGSTFLQDVRLLVASPVKSNLFLRTLKYNYACIYADT